MWTANGLIRMPQLQGFSSRELRTRTPTCGRGSRSHARRVLKSAFSHSPLWRTGRISHYIRSLTCSSCQASAVLCYVANGQKRRLLPRLPRKPHYHHQPSTLILANAVSLWTIPESRVVESISSMQFEMSWELIPWYKFRCCYRRKSTGEPVSAQSKVWGLRYLKCQFMIAYHM